MIDRIRRSRSTGLAVHDKTESVFNRCSRSTGTRSPGSNLPILARQRAIYSGLAKTLALGVADDALLRNAKLATLHRTGAAAGRPEGGGISSSTRGCRSSERRITAWT